MAVFPHDRLAEVPTVGMRDLARHAASVVREVTDGGTDRVITLQGRPVGVLSPYPAEPPRLRVAQFDALSAATEPGDHRRYELIDGVLSVTRSPTRAHQRAVALLVADFNTVVTEAGWIAMPGSDVRAGESVLCPDVMLVPDDGSETLPSLVIEVTSSDRAQDLGRKRAAYAAVGIDTYWVLDRQRAALLVWSDPADGAYHAERTITADDGPAELDTPCGPVRVDVTRLLRHDAGPATRTR